MKTIIKGFGNLLYVGKDNSKTHLKEVCLILQLIDYDKINYKYEQLIFDKLEQIDENKERYIFYLDVSKDKYIGIDPKIIY